MTALNYLRDLHVTVHCHNFRLDVTPSSLRQVKNSPSQFHLSLGRI